MKKYRIQDIFTRKNFLHINWHEIIFDVSLVLWSEFFLYSIVTRGKHLYQFLSTDQLAMSTVGITFILSWQLSIIYYHFDRKNRYIAISIILFFLALAIPFFMCLFGYWSIEGIIGKKPERSVVFWTFFGTLWGIFAGFGFGYSEKDAEEGKSVLHPRVLVLIFLTVFATFYMSMYLATIVNPFFIMAAGGAMAFVLYGVHLYLDKREPKNLSRAYKYFRKFIFPLLLFLVLCLWEELYLWGKINQAQQKKETLSFSSMVLYLFFSGVIPVRIILMLYPRVSLTGLGMGFFSLAYFLYSLHSLLAGLFP